MKRPMIQLTLISMMAIMALLLTTCEEKCNCVYPEEYIPEYHMTFNFVRTPDDNDTVYVITINTKTHEVIDSVPSTDIPPFTDIVFIDGGNKALIAGQENLYIEDMATHDTLASVPRIGYELIVSNNEKYVCNYMGALTILSLPGLDIIDNSESMITIGINGQKRILYGHKSKTNLLYTVDFSNVPSETASVEIHNMNHNPYYIRFGYLSPDNETILLSGMDDTGLKTFIELDADSFYTRSEIAHVGMIHPAWTADGNSCYGTYDGDVVKYNTATNVYSMIIDKDNIIIPDVSALYGYGFLASYVKLTSDNRYLYIQLAPRCHGPCGGYNGSTLVYDLISEEIIHRYDYTKYGWNLMAINPKDWSM